ncbi:MAG: septal ring lytic transglycosylase RlpA family protein [Spirochaetales bacterium]|nr:septal ring lytic transglycosylase RlpA family protein [Spirochaetales bacterium]
MKAASIFTTNYPIDVNEMIKTYSFNRSSLIKKLCLVWLVLLQSWFLWSLPFEEGYASWYGGKFQGRKTANGEIFDTYKLTAAHKSLAFNTYVKVVNQINKKWVIVRINDRGPFVKGRIIDLSRVGAEAIDMIGAGVARVELHKSTKDEYQKQFAIDKKDEFDVSVLYDQKESGDYRIQIGSFSKESHAVEVMKSLLKAGFEGKFEKGPSSFIRVLVINVKKVDLEKVSDKLKGLGFSNYLLREVKNF